MEALFLCQQPLTRRIFVRVTSPTSGTNLVVATRISFNCDCAVFLSGATAYQSLGHSRCRWLFHFNRFYDVATQLSSGEFSLFRRALEYQGMGDVNAIYGPFAAGFNGVLLLLAGNYVKYQVLSASSSAQSRPSACTWHSAGVGSPT